MIVVLIYANSPLKSASRIGCVIHTFSVSAFSLRIAKIVFQQCFRMNILRAELSGKIHAFFGFGF
jgi:hypothetical protein